MSLFPTGSTKWMGHYQYEGDDQPITMGCVLAFFQNESIEGGGIDRHGVFSIRGSYEKDGTFSWIKEYVDQKDLAKVVYNGVFADGILSGTWLLPELSGTFRLSQSS